MSPHTSIASSLVLNSATLLQAAEVL